ncbi:hypothetical protein M422DRAFT_35968 [Sphaerobolus stellatus SS14]|uniref:Uncharacterized protein n=1 Tax=Sphaerobolus stellatus (strain SS14) TaxID=990650 RepID=A0A0C9UBY4_SPHS4|nr:hypothetical protein M422DRAFT_35968 [Sphaerobolus stellatus SS14]
MKAFTQLFAIATVVVCALSKPVAKAACPKGALVSSKTLTLSDGRTVVQATHACDGAVAAREELFPRTLSTVNICGLSCTTSCSNVTGILPPISDDCSAISAALQIFAGDLTSSTVVVQPSHLTSLSSGTCEFFLQNTGKAPVQECWTDFSTHGTVAGAACFPPNQPFFPEGLCTGAAGTWAVGSTHS